MNLKRNEKGITLIALIITIVVLLILAVVAIGQAQESNIVGYAQNASSKYEQAQNNEVNLLSAYETTLESLTAEKLVFDVEGGRITILPASGSVMGEEYYDGGKKIHTGTFTVEPLTQSLIDALATDGLPTNVGDFLYALNVRFSEIEFGFLVLMDKNNNAYIDGDKVTVITNTISEDTLDAAADKYKNTIANTIG